MRQKTKIEWTESTWNPTTGCIKVSTGCQHCYAETMTKRFEKQWGKFNRIKLHSKRLEIPLKRKKPTLYFVNSMSDLFHHDIQTPTPLLQCQAKIKFLSLESLIGPVDKINLKGIDWVIVGGESGNQSRSLKKSWIMHIRDKAKHLNIPFFFKQWGGRSKK